MLSREERSHLNISRLLQSITEVRRDQGSCPHQVMAGSVASGCPVFGARKAPCSPGRVLMGHTGALPADLPDCLAGFAHGQSDPPMSAG